MNYGHSDEGSRAFEIKYVAKSCSLCFMTLMKKEKGLFIFLFKISERLKTYHLIIPCIIYSMYIHSLRYPTRRSLVLLKVVVWLQSLIMRYKYEYCVNSFFLETISSRWSYCDFKVSSLPCRLPHTVITKIVYIIFVRRNIKQMY